MRGAFVVLWLAWATKAQRRRRGGRQSPRDSKFVNRLLKSSDQTFRHLEETHGDETELERLLGDEPISEKDRRPASSGPRGHGALFRSGTWGLIQKARLGARARAQNPRG